MSEKAKARRATLFVAVIGRIGPLKSGDTQPERVQTSDWCLVTRKFGELPQRGKAYVGGPMACLSADRALAGAPSSGMTHVATPSVYRKVVAVSVCRSASHQRGV